MAKILYTTFLTLGFIMMLASCEECIHVRTQDAPPRIVIHGGISTDTMAHIVAVSRSAGFFSDEPPRMIDDADVTISDGDRTTVLFQPYPGGAYMTNTDVYGRVGETYTLRVVVDWDGDGTTEVYEADSRIGAPVNIDTVKLEQSEIFDNMIELRLWGKVPEGRDRFYRIMMALNYSLLNDSLRKYRLMDDEFMGSGNLVALPCYFFDRDNVENVLWYGDMVTVRVDVLDKDYGDFLQQAWQEVVGSFPIFSGPPANVEGNIRLVAGDESDEPLGAFGAFSSSYKSTVYTGLGDERR